MAQETKSLFKRFFGFTFLKNENEKLPSPVVPNPNDGSVLVGAPTNFGYYGHSQSRVDTTLSENQLITRYRDMALHPLVDWAIDEIANEAIVQDGEVEAIELDLTKCEKIPDDFKKLIVEEFNEVLELLNWENEAYQIFRNFYTDGKLYYQMLLQPDSREGIAELRYVDPRQIRKFIETVIKTDGATQITYVDIADEYFVYAPFGIDYNGTSVIPQGQNPIVNGVKLSKDSIAFVHSGIFDSTSSVILSYLHKSIRALSQLKSMENATLIYKISRSPERRVWKIPTGSMPEKQVGQYMDKIVSQYRSKAAYDSITGDLVDERKVLSIIDDIFIPVPSSGEAVSVDAIPGGQGFDDTSTIDYFNKQLLRALNVPSSRFNPDSSSLFGNPGTVTRDELKFAKMIFRLRQQFSELLKRILGTQLRLKEVLQSEEDLDYLMNKIRFKWATDNYYQEMAEAQVLAQRLEQAQIAQPMVGKYISNKWVKSKIFKQTDDEQAELKKEIDEEKASGEILEPMSPLIDPATGAAVDPVTGQPVGAVPGQDPGFDDNTQQAVGAPGDVVADSEEDEEQPLQ